MAWLLLFHFLLTLLLVPNYLAQAPQPPGNCQTTCGDANIPYPFGIGQSCALSKEFELNCSINQNGTNSTFFHNVEVVNISLFPSQARVKNQIYWQCYDNTLNIVDSSTNWKLNLTGSPFRFSNTKNKFTAIGAETLAYFDLYDGTIRYTTGCVSVCLRMQGLVNGSCSGIGCCQTAIPQGMNCYAVRFDRNFNNSNVSNFSRCSHAVLIEADSFNFITTYVTTTDFWYDVKGKVPVVVDWAIGNETCMVAQRNKMSYACVSSNSTCVNSTNGPGYFCNCDDGYEGNPYLFGGCKDINECEKDLCKDGTCINTEGSYQCACPKGTQGDGKTEPCNKIPEKFPYPARVAICSILGVAILLGLCFLVATHQQNKRHIKEKEEYERYYQMMKSHLPVFSKKQIEVATNNFAETHVLGRGGQGNVYKGLIENNQTVAIKKAKELEERQIEEFVNEIILLSQINHKNIVRLLGCCLEDKIPMLVYEFVPNGTLFKLLHRNSSRRPISLDSRLKIALDSAIALDYLHSSISHSIIHGDVKSANILLDANYTAKVSDFGASSAVPVNEIVNLVYYSHGYVDPECFSTQLITKKSDVYSFGVVMLELLTRKEAVYIDEKGENKPLATSFLSKARKNEHLEMLDEEIVTNDENVTKVIEEICEIALQCLSPKDDDRPTMEQVVEQLQKFVRFHISSPGHQIDQGEMESLLGKFPSTSDVSSSNSTQYSAVLEISTRGPR